MTDIKERLGDYHHALTSEDRQVALERIEELEAEVEQLQADCYSPECSLNQNAAMAAHIQFLEAEVGRLQKQIDRFCESSGF